MEKTDDQNENTRRCCFSIRYRRQPCARSGRIRSGRPQGFGTAAVAVSQQKLPSRARFGAVPGAPLRLEHRQGQVEGRRPGAITAAFGKLVRFQKRDFRDNDRLDEAALRPIDNHQAACLERFFDGGGLASTMVRSRLDALASHMTCETILPDFSKARASETN